MLSQSREVRRDAESSGALEKIKESSSSVGYARNKRQLQGGVEEGRGD